MRILLVTPMLPLPVSGGRTRTFNLIKHLSARHDISVLTFVQPEEGLLVAALEPYCKRIEQVPFPGFRPLGKWRNRVKGWMRTVLSRRPRYVTTFPVAAMREPLRKLLAARALDIIVLDQLYLVELLAALQTGDAPVLLAQQNVESDIAKRSLATASHPIHRLRDRLFWRQLLAFERKWLRRFAVCVAVSARDAELLHMMSPSTQIVVVPNGVDSQSFLPAPLRGPPQKAAVRSAGAFPAPDRRVPCTLLFFGTLSYGPNVGGLVWFCERVLPLVRKAWPDAQLEIVGADPVPAVMALRDLPGVHLTGFVPDVRPVLWSATVCVVPLQVGGGTRLKILEALAAGCPVVSTPLGAEGLSLVEGEHLLVASTPDQFAGAISALLGSEELRTRLALAGQAEVARRFDWQQIAPLFESACLATIAASERA